MTRIGMAVFTACGLIVGGAQAQDGARAYHLLPEGTDIISLATVHMQLGRVFEPVDTINSTDSMATTLTPSYLRTFDVFGNVGAFVVGIPFGGASTLLDTLGGDFEYDTGVTHGDLFIGGLLGLVGSPSLAPMDYVQHKPGFRAGVVTKLFLPTGDYDPDRQLNLGANRWSLHASLPISYVLGESMLDPSLTTFEIVPSVHIYGDNTDPTSMADVTGQAPLFGIEGHITRNFGNAVWASLDGHYEFGGETSADGVGNNDAVQNLSFGATLGLSLSPTVQLRLAYEEMVYSNVPNSTARTINITSAVLF